MNRYSLLLFAAPGDAQELQGGFLITNRALSGEKIAEKERKPNSAKTEPD